MTTTQEPDLRFLLIWKQNGGGFDVNHTRFASSEAAKAQGDRGMAIGWSGYLVAEVIHDA